MFVPHIDCLVAGMNLFQYGDDSASDSEGEKAQKGVEAVITRSSFCWVSFVEKETVPAKKEVPIEKNAEQPKAVNNPLQTAPL